MAKDLFNRYIWLVDTIYRAKRITFEEINERWLRNEMSEGIDLPLRTFHNHRKAIEEIFDILIECDKQDSYRYYIENADDMEKGNVRNWLLNTFAVNNLINESHKLKSRILFEEIPSGREYLTPIIEAMRDNLTLEISYKSYWREESYTFNIEPYCVKIFKQRWYLLGKSTSHDELRTYGLDRIQHLQILDIPFKYPKDFNPKDYYHHAFGIITDQNIQPAFITVKVNKGQVNYLKGLPLHHSQEEIEVAEDHSLFRYYVAPTFDFLQAILAYGENMEVISPAFFRSEAREIAKQQYQHYKK